MSPACPIPLLLCRIAILLLLIDSASGQVNTEAMRRMNLGEGLHNRIDLEFGYISGNTKFLNLGAGIRSDYVARDWYLFVVCNYRRSLQDTSLFVNRGFAHLRASYTLDSAYRIEGFAQKEFNDFIRLKDRDLAGGGVRITALQTPNRDDTVLSASVNIGIGGMWEREEREQTEGTDGGVVSLVRSTNYLALALRLNRQVDLTLTGYYQPALRDFSDVRVLIESNLSLAIVDAIAWVVTFHYRYDHEPPLGVRPYDLELKNGLAVMF